MFCLVLSWYLWMVLHHWLNNLRNSTSSTWFTFYQQLGCLKMVGLFRASCLTQWWCRSYDSLWLVSSLLYFHICSKYHLSLFGTWEEKIIILGTRCYPQLLPNGKPKKVSRIKLSHYHAVERGQKFQWPVTLLENLVTQDNHVSKISL